MARCTPDTARAIAGLVEEFTGLDHGLRLSDSFRRYDVQRQPHLDYVDGRKTAFSPSPGGSLHEVGRAMDTELESVGVSLKRIWETAPRGFSPLINEPIASRSELGTSTVVPRPLAASMVCAECAGCSDARGGS